MPAVGWLPTVECNPELVERDLDPFQIISFIIDRPLHPVGSGDERHMVGFPRV